ncbi:MAG: hypothetical protein JMJ88_00115 [Synergistaceae bacterium]|jgi:hypothetical protein|nr:hypothetical protein [Synergistaceae bacterium]
MSRAFIKEDDGMIDFIDRERARKEREERLALVEKKISLLSGGGTSKVDPEKKEQLLARLIHEREELRRLLEEDQ